jgi:Tfp pilus assembly protein PilF
MRSFRSLTIAIFVLILTVSAMSQGDVRSATGIPIPLGAPVIWGRVELEGLSRDEPRPTVTVTLLERDAFVARAMADDRGYWVIQRPIRDGAMLLVNVGGEDIGRQAIFVGGGDRFDFKVKWSGKQPAAGNTVRIPAYSRNGDNAKLFKEALALRKNDKPAALKLLQQIVASDPKDFEAWTEIGTLYFERSEMSEARKAYDAALKAKPDFIVAVMNLGKLHMAGKSYEEAAAVFEKAVEVDRGSADAHHFLGEAYLQLKKGSKAVPVLNEAIRLDPVGKADIHLRLATLYNAAGLKSKAAAEYKVFLEKNPKHPDKQKFEKYINDNPPQ